MLVAQLLK